MNRKILIALMTVVMVVGLVGGGAFALFDDTETSTGNSLGAGTLNLTVGGLDDPISAYFVGGLVGDPEGNIAPGDDGTVTKNLVNTGSIDGVASITFKDVLNGPGTTPEPEGLPAADVGELGGALLVRVQYGSTFDQTKSLDAWGTAGKTTLGDLLNGDNEDVIISWELPSTVGNEVQDDTVGCDIVFTLDQKV